MARIREVHVGVEPISRFAALAGDERMRVMEEAATKLRERYAGRALFNVNSTAVGGGVAEMLRPLLSYARGAGLDARWIVIGGDAEFFRITKRLHHGLHGSAGDGSPLGTREHRHYQQILEENARELLAFVRPGDGVILHDPQTAGLTSHLVRAGARVVWRCHIGTEHRNEEVDRAVAFLSPYVAMAELHIFSRKAYLDMGFDSARSAVVHPSVDAFSPKNAPMTREAVEGILVQTGLFEGPACPGAHTSFVQLDGSPGRVERRADMVRFGSAPKLDQPLVLQVSRWDPLKDPVGVLRGFEAALAADLTVFPHLVLAGPNVRGVADDPEAVETLESVIEALRAMPEHVRSNVTLASLPVEDVDENAAIVNALQRKADIIVQKSLQEGFGLTVTEAMWKGRAVVASEVGGISEQIIDGTSGILLHDPRSTAELAAALVRLLRDDELRERLGSAAQKKVHKDFLGIRHLLQFSQLLIDIQTLGDAGPPPE